MLSMLGSREMEMQQQKLRMKSQKKMLLREMRKLKLRKKQRKRLPRKLTTLKKTEEAERGTKYFDHQSYTLQ